jgi:hypothetical protein
MDACRPDPRPPVVRALARTGRTQRGRPGTGTPRRVPCAAPVLRAAPGGRPGGPRGQGLSGIQPIHRPRTAGSWMRKGARSNRKQGRVCTPRIPRMPIARPVRSRSANGKPAPRGQRIPSPLEPPALDPLGRPRRRRSCVASCGRAGASDRRPGPRGGIGRAPASGPPRTGGLGARPHCPRSAAAATLAVERCGRPDADVGPRPASLALAPEDDPRGSG